jgi:hypothetical protein
MKHDCILPPEPISPKGDDYRKLAGEIREFARNVTLPSARRDLVRLAARYYERTTLLDNREYYW